MDSMHLIDLEIKPIIDLLPAFELNAETLPALRSSILELVAANAGKQNPDVIVEEKFVPGPPDAPPVRVVIYRPAHSKGDLPALFHVHGGGFVAGVPESVVPGHDVMVAELGCVIVSVDYRLAPETPHPGPVEDCYAALSWLYDHAAELGVDRNRIGIGGESAGGGMAAALALLVRDRGEMTLRFQHLVSPMLDDRTCTAPAANPYAGEFTWTREKNCFGWTSLLGHSPGGDDVSYYAAPARAESLADLPPTFINVGALDLFVDEIIEYARRLLHAGVPVELHIYPGAIHAFEMASEARVTAASNRDRYNALRRAFTD
jgi:acetyl esterase/lipase